MGHRKRRIVNRHHIQCRSRLGSDEDMNIVAWDSEFHASWHDLFVNMLVDEVIMFIRIITAHGLAWERDNLVRLTQAIKDDDVIAIQRAIKEATDEGENRKRLPFGGRMP